MLQLHRLVAEHLSTVAAEFDLKPGQAQALQQLQPNLPMTMGDVARGIRCDPSTITGIADRLEERGLVRREPSEKDRRVKSLVLTKSGEALRRKLLLRLADVPEELARLPEGKQRELRRLLQETLNPS